MMITKYFWVLDNALRKTSNLKTSPESVGNSNRHFSLFYEVLQTLTNQEYNKQIDQENNCWWFAFDSKMESQISLRFWPLYGLKELSSGSFISCADLHLLC